MTGVRERKCEERSSECRSDWDWGAQVVFVLCRGLKDVCYLTGYEAMEDRGQRVGSTRARDGRCSDVFFPKFLEVLHLFTKYSHAARCASRELP